jgi:hypothetical protein
MQYCIIEVKSKNAILHFWAAVFIMALWRFMDYCSEAGNNLIEEWYLDQSENVQADFDATLKNLSITPE